MRGDPGEASGTKAGYQYQTALGLLHPRAGIGTGFDQAGSESSAAHRMPLPANTMEADVGFLCRDSGGAVIGSKDRELVESGTQHRGGTLHVGGGEEAETNTFRPVRQLLYTGPCDLFQDGATAASIGTLERQEQQDTLKVRGDPGEDSGVANPRQLLNPGHTDTMPCEHLSIKTLEKGTVFGFRLYHTCLSHEAATERWNQACNASGTTGLYRDEVIYTHSYVQTYIESIKSYGKKMTEVKECHAVAHTEHSLFSHSDGIF